MAAVNRKQVPLCRVHHMALHNHQLTEVERRKYLQGLLGLVGRKTDTVSSPPLRAKRGGEGRESVSARISFQRKLIRGSP